MNQDESRNPFGPIETSDEICLFHNEKNEKNIKGYAAHRDASLPVYVSRRKLCSKTWLTRAAPATIPSTWPPPLANSKCKKPRSINPWTQQP
jgi:hypothetical protein